MDEMKTKKKVKIDLFGIIEYILGMLAVLFVPAISIKLLGVVLILVYFIRSYSK